MSGMIVSLMIILIIVVFFGSVIIADSINCLRKSIERRGHHLFVTLTEAKRKEVK